MSLSIAQEVAKLPPDEQLAVIEEVGAEEFMRDWAIWGRPEQLISEHEAALPWFVALYMGGRGSGKTRSGGEWICDRTERGFERSALVGRTAADCRDVMIEGESGLEAICERRKMHCRYLPSKRRFTIRHGRRHKMRCTTYSAEEPEQLSGPQHDTAWADEGGSWAPVVDQAGRTTWDNLMLGLRLSDDPRCLLTTTPRSKALIRGLLDDRRQVANGGDVLVLASTMWDNAANLAPQFIRAMLDLYANTRLGPQELLGQLIDGTAKYFARSWFSERMLSPEEWFKQLDARRGSYVRVRYWDLAHARETDANPDPDWTAGSLMAWDSAERRWVYEDLRMIRDTAKQRDDLILKTAREDGRDVTVWVERTPGAGKDVFDHLRDDVLGPEGFVCRDDLVGGRQADKETRAEFPSSMAEARRLYVVEAPWNAAAFDQMEDFPDLPHDDIVDSISGAFKVMRRHSDPDWTDDDEDDDITPAGQTMNLNL